MDALQEEPLSLRLSGIYSNAKASCMVAAALDSGVSEATISVKRSGEIYEAYSDYEHLTYRGPVPVGMCHVDIRFPSSSTGVPEGFWGKVDKCMQARTGQTGAESPGQSMIGI